MIKQEVIEYIKSNSEKDIYYEYMLGQSVWYFEKYRKESSSIEYDSFKKFISKSLDVPFNDIAIVGSAKTKYSFSPTDKLLTEFHDGSDFDLIIVSKRMYRNIWVAYKKIASNRFLKNYQGKCSDIFNGFISIKDNDDNYGNDVLIEWQQKVSAFKAALQLKFNLTHEINYRIYTDWESVQDYHLRGIVKLKEKINETY